jgi:hypothetical protein
VFHQPGCEDPDLGEARGAKEKREKKYECGEDLSGEVEES